MKNCLFILGLLIVSAIGAAIGAAGMTFGGIPGFLIVLPICVLIGAIYGRIAALYL